MVNEELPPEQSDDDIEAWRESLELSRPRWWESAGVSLVPWVGPFIAEYQKQMWQEESERFLAAANQRQIERVVQTLVEIPSLTELAVEDAIQKISDNERLSDLLYEALRAAARSSYEPKRKALGRVLANALEASDDAQVDQAELLVRALAQMEAPHVRVMAILYSPPPFGTHPMQVDHIRLLHPHLGPTVDALLLQLSGWGLVTTRVRRPLPGRDDDQYATPDDLTRAPDYLLTHLGQEVLRLLEAEPKDDSAE